MRRATLKLIGGDWYVDFQDCLEVKRLFGGSLVRTPYSAQHAPDWVLVEVLITLDDCELTLERPALC